MESSSKWESVEETADNASWVAGEVAGCEFRDARLGKRLGSLLHQLSGSIGGTIPFACQDWANTKAAYRFLSNDDVDEHTILAGHFEATRNRVQTSSGPVLILQDITEFSYQRNKPEQVGFTGKTNSGKDKTGRLRLHTVCGILMHSSLAVTTDGLPLGLCAIKFWSRQKFKGTRALKNKINPTRIPIEGKESFRWLQNMQQSSDFIAQPERCVHIGDRESDIYELFAMAEDLKTGFLVRTCSDRLVGDGDHTISDEMADVRVHGLHRVELRDTRGQACEALLEIRYRRMKVLPPVGKQKRYPALHLTVIHAQERDAPSDRAPLEWKLLTNLQVRSKADAIEKINWYAMRWKIETFHKILKSGCRAEDSRLRTAERLANLISIYCILSWRIFWVTMLNRTDPATDPSEAFTDTEISVLDRLSPKTAIPGFLPRTLAHYTTQLAKLGGYLARKGDPPPGNIVMWRGLTRLTDIVLGMQLAAKVVGN